MPSIQAISIEGLPFYCFLFVAGDGEDAGLLHHLHTTRLREWIENAGLLRLAPFPPYVATVRRCCTNAGFAKATQAANPSRGSTRIL